MYRCVKANESDDVIAIGMDENQGGQDYHGIGVWCEFSFEVIPEASESLLEEARQTGKSCLKVVGNTVVIKDQL